MPPKPAPSSGKAKAQTSLRPIAENKKAFFNYQIEERLEAGVVLEGWEVKAARQGTVQLTDGYVLVREGEVFLMGCQIQPLASASTHHPTQALRTKKLLLHKTQIKRWMGKVQQKGYTLVALNLHWKAGKVKCEVALAKGKTLHDKRHTLKERETKREVERVMKGQRFRSQ